MTLGIIIFVLLGLALTWKGALVLYRSSAGLQARRDAERIELREASQRFEDEQAHFAASLLRGRMVREYVKLKADQLDRLHPNAAMLIRGMAYLEERVETLEQNERGPLGLTRAQSARLDEIGIPPSASELTPEDDAA